VGENSANLVTLAKAINAKVVESVSSLICKRALPCHSHASAKIRPLLLLLTLGYVHA
jgi:hypothetical protein